MPEPNEVTWYIEATDWDEQVHSRGSAVAIGLRDSRNEVKAYLLTCAHVVRGPAEDGKEQYGKGLPKIRSWRCGMGYAPAAQRDRDGAGYTMSVVKEIKSLDQDVPPGQARENKAEDWVVLEFENGCQKADATPFVNPPSHAIDQDTKLAIWGFPDGKRSFEEAKVEPTPVTQLKLKNQADGVLTLTEGQTAPGLSGGPVFDTDGNWVGIHRERRDSVLQKIAVDAAHIRRKVEQRKYTFVEWTISEPPIIDQISEAAERLRKLAAGILADDDLRKYLLKHNNRPFERSTNDLTDEIFAVVPGKDLKFPTAMTYLFNCSERDDCPSERVREGIAKLISVLAPISFEDLAGKDMVRMANCVYKRQDLDSAVYATVESDRPLIGTAQLGRLMGLQIDVKEYVSKETSGQYTGFEVKKGRNKVRATTVMPEGGIKPLSIVATVAAGLHPITEARSCDPRDVRAVLRKEADRHSYFVLWLQGTWDEDQLRPIRDCFPPLLILVSKGQASDLNLRVVEQIRDLHKEFGP